MADDTPENPGAEAERLNAAIDRLLAERRPDPAITAEEAALLRMAVLLCQASAGAATPRPAFTALLTRSAQGGGAVFQRRMSRRAALAVASTLAAGLTSLAAGRRTTYRSRRPPTAERPQDFVLPPSQRH